MLDAGMNLFHSCPLQVGMDAELGPPLAFFTGSSKKLGFPVGRSS
jgi:hypothetical protein